MGQPEFPFGELIQFRSMRAEQRRRIVAGLIAAGAGAWANDWLGQQAAVELGGIDPFAPAPDGWAPWSETINSYVDQVQLDTMSDTLFENGVRLAGPDWSLPNPRAMAHAEQRVNQIAGLGDDIWANEMRPELIDSIARGDSIDEAALRIEGRLDSFYHGRAQTIARTTIISATNAAQHEVGLQFAFGARSWLATSDGRTRPTHAAASGQRAEPGEPFIVGGFELDYPGDPAGPAAEIINCRCTILFPDLDEGAPPDTKEALEYQSHTGAWHAMSAASENLATTAARVNTIADRVEGLARDMQRLQWHRSRENVFRLAYNQSTERFDTLLDALVKDASGNIDFASSALKGLNARLRPPVKNFEKLRNRTFTTRRHLRDMTKEVADVATHRLVPSRVTELANRVEELAEQATEQIGGYQAALVDSADDLADLDLGVVIGPEWTRITGALRDADPVRRWAGELSSFTKTIEKTADDLMAKGRDIDHGITRIANEQLARRNLPTLDDLFDAASGAQSVGDRITSLGVRLNDLDARRVLPDELGDLLVPGTKWRNRWDPIERRIAAVREQSDRLQAPLARIREVAEPVFDGADDVARWLDEDLPMIREKLNVIGRRSPGFADRMGGTINAVDGLATQLADQFVRPGVQIIQDARRILDAADLMVDQSHKTFRTYERVGKAYARLFDETGSTASIYMRFGFDVLDAEKHATSMQLLQLGSKVSSLGRTGRLQLRDPIKMPADLLRGVAKSLRYISNNTAEWDRSLQAALEVIESAADAADLTTALVFDLAELSDDHLRLLADLPDAIADAVTAAERAVFPGLDANGLPLLPRYLPVIDDLLPDGARLPDGMRPISQAELGDVFPTFGHGVGDATGLMMPVGTWDAQVRPVLLQQALDLYGHEDAIEAAAPGVWRTIARLDRDEAAAAIAAKVDDDVRRGLYEPPDEVLSRLPFDPDGPAGTTLHAVRPGRPPKPGDTVDLDGINWTTADDLGDGGPVVYETLFDGPATEGVVEQVIDMGGLIVVRVRAGAAVDDLVPDAGVQGLLPAVPEQPIAQKFRRRLQSVDTIQYHQFADERGRLELPQFSSSTIAVTEARAKARFDDSRRLLAELRADLRDTAQTVADENRQFLESRFQGSGDRVAVARTKGAPEDEWFYERLSPGERQSLLRNGFVYYGTRDRADQLADLAGETAAVDEVMEEWVGVVQDIITADQVAKGAPVPLDADVSFLERGLDDFDPNMLVKRRGPKGTGTKATTEARIYLSEKGFEIDERDAIWALEAVDAYELGPEPWNMSFAGWRAEIFDLLDGETSLSDTQIDRRIEELIPPNLYPSLDVIEDMEQAHHEIVEMAIRAGRLLPSE